jgi:hypothetical protein
MIGDDEFDVIVLEYYMMAGDGLALLARRLRERFPDAIIVILRLWAPDRIWRNGDGSQKVHNEIGLLKMGSAVALFTTKNLKKNTKFSIWFICTY